MSQYLCRSPDTSERRGYDAVVRVCTSMRVFEVGRFWEGRMIPYDNAYSLIRHLWLGLLDM